MIRSVAHILLILLVLTCPVQCVVSGDSCCASASAVSSTDSLTDAAESCRSSRSCCHQTASDVESCNATDEGPTQVPLSDDECQCDCLCKGAIASAVRIADDFESMAFNSIADCLTEGTALSRGLAAPLADPPDPISGREIRTLRMSFQV
jgi:hypothetical protein